MGDKTYIVDGVDYNNPEDAERADAKGARIFPSLDGFQQWITRLLENELMYETPTLRGSDAATIANEKIESDQLVAELRAAISRIGGFITPMAKIFTGGPQDPEDFTGVSFERKISGREETRIRAMFSHYIKSPELVSDNLELSANALSIITGLKDSMFSKTLDNDGGISVDHSGNYVISSVLFDSESGEVSMKDVVIPDETMRELLLEFQMQTSTPLLLIRRMGKKWNDVMSMSGDDDFKDAKLKGFFGQFDGSASLGGPRMRDIPKILPDDE